MNPETLHHGYNKPNKRSVLAFDGDKLKVDPDFCDHKNAATMYREVDGVLLHCPDCRSLVDENGEIVIFGSEEIPF